MKGQDPCLAPGPYQFGVHHWYRLPGSDANMKKALHGADEVVTMRNSNDVQDATLPLNDAEEEDEEEEDEEEEKEEEEEEERVGCAGREEPRAVVPP